VTFGQGGGAPTQFAACRALTSDASALSLSWTLSPAPQAHARAARGAAMRSFTVFCRGRLRAAM